MRNAWIAVDPQNDFCTGGALAVEGGEEVIPAINRLMPGFDVRVVTQDWHPRDHISFAEQHEGREPFEKVRLPYGEQTLWPRHCVIGEAGAEFHPDLDLRAADLIVRKGFRGEIDSYSAFYENDRLTPTGLAGYLKDRGVERVVLGGLALDFCVLWTARDARRLGFEVIVAMDACRAIDLEGSKDAAEKEMRDLGCRLAATEELIHAD